MARTKRQAALPRLVDKRNRVALTREVLRALDIRPGDYVTFVVDELGGVKLYKLDIRVAPLATPSAASRHHATEFSVGG